ncbi:MAG: RNA polymerase sigma factor [Actinomycetota bacterium]
MEPATEVGRPLVVDEVADEVVVELPAVMGRQRDFESFYRSQWESVYRPLAVTLRDADLAREAVDEGMIRAYRHWRKVRGYRNQAGWVYRVSFNWAISQMRRRKREVFVRRPVEDPQPAHHPPVDLYDALSALDLKHRAVIVLRYLLDWSEEDVADALGIAPGTVKSRLSRAMDKLRNELTWTD